MPSKPDLDPFEAAPFLLIGAITAIDLRGDTFHVGGTQIAIAEKRLLAGVLIGMRVEVLGIQRDGRHVDSCVTASE